MSIKAPAPNNSGVKKPAGIGSSGVKGSS